MTTVRANTHRVDIDIEQSFGTLNGDFDTDKDQLYAYNVSHSLERPAIENPALRQDTREHAPGLGFRYPDASLAFTVALLGLGSAATASQADHTAQSKALGSVFGVDAEASSRRSSGSTVEASPSPTTTTFTEADVGNHAVDQLVPVEIGGVYYVRPITGYSSGAITLGIALPSAPSSGDGLLGASNVEWNDEASADLETYQLELIGKSTDDNYRILGGVASCSFPERGVNEAPEMALTYRLADAVDLFSKSVSPTVAPLPYAAHGGELLLAAQGSTEYVSLKHARIGLEIGATYGPKQDYSDEEKAIEGWFRADTQTRCTLTMSKEEDISALTNLSSGASTIRESWRAGWTSATPDRYQILWSSGRKQGGRGFTVHLADVVMIEPPTTDSETNGRKTQQVVFAPLIGGDTPRIMAAFW